MAVTQCVAVTTCVESGRQDVASRFSAVRSYDDKTGNNDASDYNNTGSFTRAHVQSYRYY